MANDDDYDDGPEELDPDDFRRVSGMDPAANWLLRLAVDDYLPEPRTTPIPFLLELEDGEALDAFRSLPAIREGNEGNGALVLGFGDEASIIAESVPLPVLASLDWFTRLLADGDERLAIFRDTNKSILLSSPPLPGQVTESFPDFPEGVLSLSGNLGPPAAGWPADTVFMAVIDDGIAFAHERFRLGDTDTRVHAFWNMNRAFPFPPRRPVRLPLRGELTKRRIDAYLSRSITGGAVDEDAVYAATRLISHRDPRHKSAAWRAAHGTHVLDLAAGYDPGAARRDRPIIAVQLPAPVVARTTGELLDWHAWLAIRYVLDRADQLAGRQRIPVVINTSFGYIAGPHDGTGWLERHMERMIRRQRHPARHPARVVLPAGNAHLSRCHAVIDLDRQPQVEFDLIVQPDDRTHSVVQVWLPRDRNGMRLTVELPDGTPYTIPRMTPRGLSWSVEMTDATGVFGRVERTRHMARPPRRRRWVISIRIAPTERPQPHAGALAPAGRWHLTFGRLTGRGLVAHAWAQRDDSLYGYPQRGRQSYFDHDDYVRFAERGTFDPRGVEVTDDDDPAQAATPSPVTRESLFNAIATGASVITAGGYQERDGRLVRYSAGGPNTPRERRRPARYKPDALLPSDGSKAHPGILAAGSRSGARVAMSGTSVAAPQLARWVANMLARGPGDRPAVRARAMASLLWPNPQPTDPAIRPDRAGWGRLRRRDPLRARRFEP
jgi:hypothetical protein